MKKKKKCIAPLSSILIGQDSYVAPCCAWHGEYEKVDSNTSLKAASALLKSSKIAAIKNKLSFETLKSCSLCTYGSAQYKTHNQYADSNIDYMSSPTITNLHLKVSNFCNLACRMCDPESSSILAAENNKIYNNGKHPHISSSLPIDSILFKSIIENLKNIRYLWCSGGEPLIQKEIWTIIEYCYDNNLAKNIVLKFNTNGTVTLKESQIKQLVAFKEVFFDISVDGTGHIGEYIRTKSNWKQWQANFEKYNDLSDKYSNIHIHTNTAVSIFNIHIIDELYDYIGHRNQGSYAPVWFPEEQSIRNLPTALKKELLDKITHRNAYDFLSLLKMETNKNINIKKYIDTLDDTAINSRLYKNYKRFFEVDPEWYERITNENNS